MTGRDGPASIQAYSISTVRPSAARLTLSVIGSPSPARGFAQLEALDLPGGRLRQLRNEPDLARILVRSELAFHERLQRIGQRVVARSRLQHYVRERARQPALVLAHDGGFEHRLVAHERRFDLERRDEL